MNEHQCLLSIGSNTGCRMQLAAARRALADTFPGISFSQAMETEAVGRGMRTPFCNQLARCSTLLPVESVRDILKDIERHAGRRPNDKAQGVVRLDIDVLVYDNLVLKPDDMRREYVARILNTF